MVLVGVWAGAAAGIVFTLVWVARAQVADAASRTWRSAGSRCVAAPQLVDRAGIAALVLLLGGGVLYTAGAVVYALRRPDPRPAVFGYHEMFHVLVVAAAVMHFVAVAAFALPAAA